MSAGVNSELDAPLVFRNLESHLLELAADTALIGKTVSELTDVLDTNLKPSTISDLQKLDNLHQCLNDVAGLCAALADSEVSKSQALSRLKLKSTQSLLNEMPDKRCATSRGSVDIF